VQINTSRETVIQEMVVCVYEESDFDKLGKKKKIAKTRKRLRYRVSGLTFHANQCSTTATVLTLNTANRIPKTIWIRSYAGVSCRFSPGSVKCGCNTARILPCCSAIVNKAFCFVADKQQFCYYTALPALSKN